MRVGNGVRNKSSQFTLADLPGFCPQELTQLIQHAFSQRNDVHWIRVPVQRYQGLKADIINTSRTLLDLKAQKCSLRDDLSAHLWPHLLQGGEGGDVRVCHRPRDGDTKQEPSLNVAGEIKPWKTKCELRGKKE